MKKVTKSETFFFFFNHLPYTIYFTIYHLFIYLFTDLFKERACPQLAKANLGGPCLNKQIAKKTYIYTDKKISNKKKKYSIK